MGGEGAKNTADPGVRVGFVNGMSYIPAHQVLCTANDKRTHPPDPVENKLRPMRACHPHVPLTLREATEGWPSGLPSLRRGTACRSRAAPSYCTEPGSYHGTAAPSGVEPTRTTTKHVAALSKQGDGTHLGMHAKCARTHTHTCTHRHSQTVTETQTLTQTDRHK